MNQDLRPANYRNLKAMCKQRGFVALILAVTIMAVMIVMVDMALPAQAEVTAAKLSQSELADIERVEHALNQIKTLQAKFLQVADNGRHSAGTFSMWRPGRMRLNYDPPIKDYIVADGWFIFFWDGELQQQSSQPIDASLADFFLRETIKLSGDVTVTRFSHQFGVIEVAIVQTTDAGQGELTMVFEDKPLQLRAWRVLDAQGLTTTVTLSDVRTGMKFSDDLFLFRDPTIGRPSKR